MPHTETTLSRSGPPTNHIPSDIALDPQPPPPAPPISADAGSKGGEGGGSLASVTNASFLSAVYRTRIDGCHPLACTKSGDPTEGPWIPIRADPLPPLPAGANNYLNCATFRPDEKRKLRAKKEQFGACHFLLLDDLGSKVPLDRLRSFAPSWLIETSPGNYQAGILLRQPLADGQQASDLHAAIVSAGLCDDGAGQPQNRWARLPVGANGKAKYALPDGSPFPTRLVRWEPDRRYSPEEIRDGLALAPPIAAPPRVPAPSRVPAPAQPARVPVLPRHTGSVLAPATENPVVAALRARGLHKRALGEGKHEVRCPWVEEHTDGLDTGAAYFEPSQQYPAGGFRCQHSHGSRLHLAELLSFLKVSYVDARNKPVILVQKGELDLVVEDAEKLLAGSGRHYQYGGLIVTVADDPATGEPAIAPVSPAALALDLSTLATWQQYDGRAKEVVRCDPPQRHTSILYDAKNYRHLPHLEGIARQPYLRESDGAIVTVPGYDRTSRRLGIFDPGDYPAYDSSRAGAEAALGRLRELLREFRFVSPHDEAAALSAMLCAVARPSLPLAPAYHVRASVYGSGKSYLCEVVGSFASAAAAERVSYPATSEEANKVILSLLLKAPPCIEFDDMDSDWTPHGVIKRMLTSQKISERILGVSKTATVSTRSLVLSSGNNVGPVRDMLRRVLTIHLDPRVETPATLRYEGNPLAMVRKDRGRYVMDCLAIIDAWRRADRPRQPCDNIVTYDGPWSDCCRHPLMWLGLPDPATSMLEQVRHDPDAEALRGLMEAWHEAFGSTPTTIRRALEAQVGLSDLDEAIREFPVLDGGAINRSKFGWLLRKNANRIVGGLEFRAALADGRTAWQVVRADTPK
jgi:hypothetical protein